VIALFLIINPITLKLRVKDFSLPSEGKIVYEWLKKHGENIRKPLF